MNPTSVNTRRKRGFSLLELTVSMALFLIVGGAAVSLIRRHQPLFGAQQSQVGLNLSLRNAAALMQNDAENAGTGYYQGVNLPSFPIGITITNNSAGTTSCYDPTTKTYGPTCFDSFTVITIDNSVPPAHPSPPCSPTTNSSTLFAQPQDPSLPLSTLAGAFHDGDWVMVISGDGSTMVDTVLTKNGEISGPNVHLAHNPTGAGNADPLGITQDLVNNNKLMQYFCSDGWVLRIAAIQYSVDATNPANPKLVRQVLPAGAKDVVAEQVIGFKVGAWNDVTSSYSYNSSAAPVAGGYNNDWAKIRSIRVSVIARSNPVGDMSFHNNFDQGNYYVQSAAVVINPRNLSMNK